MRSAELVEVTHLLKGYESPGPIKNLLPALLEAGHILRSIGRSIRGDEESRSGFIDHLLPSLGYRARDKIQWGCPGDKKTGDSSKTKAGTPAGTAKAIIEAFNLKDFDAEVIDRHVGELLAHEPGGMGRGFILVYSGAGDFPGLWEKYVQYLGDIDTHSHCRIEGPPGEIGTRYPGIKAARSYYRCKDKEMDLYHIFIDMKEN
jgi:hypothetical protein